LPSWALANVITFATTAFGAAGAPSMSTHFGPLACTTLKLPLAYFCAVERTLFTYDTRWLYAKIAVRMWSGAPLCLR
jgi:hypothetical protein